MNVYAESLQTCKMSIVNIIKSLFEDNKIFVLENMYRLNSNSITIMAEQEALYEDLPIIGV